MYRNDDLAWFQRKVFGLKNLDEERMPGFPRLAEAMPFMPLSSIQYNVSNFRLL